MSKIERYLVENGYNQTGAKFFSTVTENGLYRYYEKDNTTIFYGMFLYGNPPHLFIPEELIEINNINENIDKDEFYYTLMQRIESFTNPKIIEQSLYNKNIVYSYDGFTNTITIKEIEPLVKTSLPPAILFVLAAKKQNITIV